MILQEWTEWQESFGMSSQRHGVMWEEVGIDPGLPFEEKVKLYHMQMLG